MPLFKEQNMETDRIRADRDSSSKRPLRYDKISLGGASHKQSDYPHDPARQFIQKQLEKAQMGASSSSGSKIVYSLKELEEVSTQEREKFQERSRETSDQKERRISNKRCNVIRR
jgi:hypothetical protein